MIAASLVIGAAGALIACVISPVAANSRQAAVSASARSKIEAPAVTVSGVTFKMRFMLVILMRVPPSTAPQRAVE